MVAPVRPCRVGSEAEPSATIEALRRHVGRYLARYGFDPVRMHVLNRTARELYLLCDGKRSMGELVREFASRFDVDEAIARQDAGEAIEHLVSLGLIKLP